MTTSILLAGFGGQGLLFAGKQLASAAMKKDLFVTWLPSYGPEMRGGTANCSVIISDEPIGSPLVTNPDVLIAMNLPSYEKFEPAIVPGGILISDSTMISAKSTRSDIQSYYIPATGLAEENALKGLANVIMLGKLLQVKQVFDKEYLAKSMTESIPAAKAHLAQANIKALETGYTQK
jgi:Pyruvate:ferredoxin oxidoreductase and related 2-oxoacid:ferredoxin oxidoreductases, gamma subunit